MSAAPLTSLVLLAAPCCLDPDSRNGVSPSALSGELMRPLPVVFVASLNGGSTGVSTLELASCDCVSALTLICGSTSAMAVDLRLSLNEGCNTRFTDLIGPTALLQG